jgi:hypothetical protein
MEIQEAIETLEQMQSAAQGAQKKALSVAIKTLRAAARKKQKPAAAPAPGYQDAMDAYFEWHRATVGVAPRITSRDGAALKEILKYLSENSKSQDHEGALAAWRFILLYWDTLNKFLQSQVSLNSIAKNLPEIIMQIRQHATDRKKRGTTDSVMERIRRRRQQDDSQGGDERKA